MERAFFEENRRVFTEWMGEGSVAVLFSGAPVRRSADEDYPFSINRNFYYLTGLTKERIVCVLTKLGGVLHETAYIPESDERLERWMGRRYRAEDIEERAGITDVKPYSAFERDFHWLMISGRYESIYLDFDAQSADEPVRPETGAWLASVVRERYPFVAIRSLNMQLRRQRTIKKPCEIEAMRKAMTVTKAGIEAMMRASRPGMWEYEYKAIFDKTLTDNGVLTPGFPSIISAGKSNFQIHYYDYTNQAHDGDMILNDVGAAWEYLTNDVSRGFPCNGKFSDKQRALYECAYATSEHMFSTIKPGMPMADVDRLAREYNYQLLHKLGLVESYEEVGKLIWHGGAHHVGLDVHDEIDYRMPIAPGMVFCVDIGIYCEDWGIGFRLEDNCLVTETGCENLSAAIPRSIEDIERVMGE